VLRIDGPAPYLVRLEMQASRDATLPRRLVRYNTLLDLGHDLRVRSIALLLRPEADDDNLTGTLELRLPGGVLVHRFHYDVFRVWERPVGTLMVGDVGTLPLAPLADVPPEEVPEIVREVDARLVRKTPPDVAATIMETTLILAGMRLGEEWVEALQKGLHTMNITTGSSYYRLAHREGRE
jgi:hypothetical protein